MAFITINGNSYEIYSPIPLVNALLTTDDIITPTNVQISLDQIPSITAAMEKLDMTTLGIIMQEPKDQTIHVVSDVTIETSVNTVSTKRRESKSTTQMASSPVTQQTVPTIYELATYK
jgi:hypothetical protein